MFVTRIRRAAFAAILVVLTAFLVVPVGAQDGGDDPPTEPSTPPEDTAPDDPAPGPVDDTTTSSSSSTSTTEATDGGGDGGDGGDGICPTDPDLPADSPDCLADDPDASTTTTETTAADDGGEGDGTTDGEQPDAGSSEVDPGPDSSEGEAVEETTTTTLPPTSTSSTTIVDQPESTSTTLNPLLVAGDDRPRPSIIEPEIPGPTNDTSSGGTDTDRTIKLVIGLLLVVATLIALLTFRYWWYTNPRRSLAPSRTRPPRVGPVPAVDGDWPGPSPRSEPGFGLSED